MPSMLAAKVSLSGKICCTRNGHTSLGKACDGPTIRVLMQGAKVLVVDDSTSVRKVLEKLLASRGLIVTTSESAEKGLEAINHSAPNLIIADVVMPGMSGFELCQMIKMRASTKSIPVILISGIINEGVITQAQQAGAFDVVSKPFTPDDLFPKVERALNAVKQSFLAVDEAVSISNPVTTPSPTPAEPFAPPPPVPSLANQEPSPQSVPEPLKTPPAPNLLDELKPFLDKPEIESVFVIDSTGQLITWLGQTLDEPELLATYVHTLLSISNVMGEKYHLSSVQSLNLEYLGKTLIINRIGDKSSLVLILRGTGGTGVIRYLVLKQMPQLKAALSG